MPEDSKQSENSFLVKGDLSGIQSFIFNVKSTEAARSLKGRSFFLKILLELGMQMIFDAIGISSAKEIEEAKISTSGGNFILKLPKDPSLQINEIQKKLNNALQFTGLNYVLVCSPEQGEYQSALKELNSKARERKYNLLLNDYTFFAPFNRGNFQDILSNKKWIKITEQLKNKEITHFQINFSEEEVRLHLDIRKDLIILAGYQISFGTSGTPLNRYLESIFPVRGNRTILFEQLAKSDRFNSKSQSFEINGGERGIEKLGILAMDVDNLGVAVESVKNHLEHYDFDKELQEFFNNQLRQIIKSGFYKDRNGKQIPKYDNKVYPVTAGGDDTMFVGKWNTLLDLASEIRKAFLKQFKDRGLSISAALLIVKPNFPVVRFAEMAEDALKAAKYTYEGQKGNINLFGEVLHWDIFQKEILHTRKEFRKYAKTLISNGLLAKARQTAAKISEQDGLTLSDMWKMGYYMRDLGPKGKHLLEMHRNHLERSLSEQNPLKRNTYRLSFPIAARLAEFDERLK